MGPVVGGELLFGTDAVSDYQDVGRNGLRLVVGSVRVRRHCADIARRPDVLVVPNSTGFVDGQTTIVDVDAEMLEADPAGVWGPSRGPENPLVSNRYLGGGEHHRGRLGH